MGTNDSVPMSVVHVTSPFSFPLFSSRLSSYPSLVPAAATFPPLSAAAPLQSLDNVQ